jgi:endonuclease/exonuclease/phosphatase family metal-dependent hydrolase
MPSSMTRVGRAVLGLVTIVVVHRVVRDPLRRTLERPVPLHVLDKGPRLRIVTWNVRNFPDESEQAYLADRLAELVPDVVALQELRDPEAATALLPEHVLHVSSAGGRGGQHVALAFDARLLELAAGPVEHAELSMGGRVRPALSATLRHRESGMTFVVIVVHLKATPRGHALRREQWERLAEVVPGDDVPTFVLGDFNTTGPPGAEPALELAALEARLATVGLRRLDAGACTAYWEGTRHDAWKEPSMLDLIWVRALPRWEDLEARAWGPCARYACQPFRSAQAYPDPDLLRGSDHCPVSVDVPLTHHSLDG